MFHKRLLNEFKENKKYVAGMIGCQWISLIANIMFVYGTSMVIQGMYEKTLTDKNIQAYLILLVCVLAVRSIMNTVGTNLSYQASTNVKIGLREKVYRKLMKLGSSYRSTLPTSEAVQISTEGVEQLEIYFGKYVPQFFYSLLAPLTLFLVVAVMSIKVAIVLLLCVPLIPISIIAVQKFAKKMLAKYWGTYTELGDAFLESLQGLTTMKIFQADERYAEKMDEDAEKFRKVTMRVLIMQLNSISIMDLVAYGGAAAGIILAVMELKNSRITMQQCFFIIMVSQEFFLPLRLLGSFFHIAMNGNAAANKIFKLLDAKEEKKEMTDFCQDSSIVFKNVTFGYDDEKTILKDISFEIKENSFTAIAGVSGCGKSTISSIIMGKNKAGHGEVLIGGVQAASLSSEARFEKITCINHDSYLFKGTLRENLQMGKENASDEEMCAALKQVDLYDTVMKKGGLDMEIKEKAGNLSGGQKQRLALARAILHGTDIYIFDEAASNIDAESENKIMEVVKVLAKTKTVILISHRLANLLEADQILVMDQGVVAESGTHETLMSKKGYYHTLFESQKQLENYAKEVF